MAQNRQLQSFLPISKSFKLIKFCYFIIALLFISCDTNTANKKEKPLNEHQKAEIINAQESKSKTQTILFFGDSITAGYGLEDTDEAFPGLIQQKIDSLGLKYSVINSGLSGETSAGGKNRIKWVIQQKPSIFVLELGANDGLRGVAVKQTKTNLQAIINTVKEKSPHTKIILTGMQMPPNLGLEYTTKFKQLFIDLARENNLAFIPFILKDVGGVASLNQSDGIHPNTKGHKVLANTVWEVLAPFVKS